MTDDQIQQKSAKFDMLTPTQRLYVIARAMGRKVGEAATAAGVNRTTPATWDQELISAAILERQAELGRNAAAAVAPFLPAALGQLEQAVKAGDMTAIREVFDRTWGKARQHQEIKSEGEPLIVKVIYGDGISMDDL